MTFARYTLDGKVCMVVRNCLWSNGWGLVYRLGLGLGPSVTVRVKVRAGARNGVLPFFIFFCVKIP